MLVGVTLGVRVTSNDNMPLSEWADAARLAELRAGHELAFAKLVDELSQTAFSGFIDHSA
jgi:hypothetical protein